MTYVVFAVIAYMIGSTPFGLIIGKKGYGVDIREHGSGNLGGTNTFRVLGVKAGLLVTTGDILKGTLSAILPSLMGYELSPLIIGLFAVVGHMYPIFANFKGGKAVATSGGVILAASPILFFISLATFFLVLYISKYVSLASIITGIITVIVSLFLQNTGLIIVTSILAVFVLYRHRTNIVRIKNKTEPKISWM